MAQKVFSYNLTLSHNTFVTGGLTDGQTDTWQLALWHSCSASKISQYV